MIEAGLVFLQD